MSSSVLLVDQSDGIALVTLNRPNVMNTLSGELRVAIAEAFREFQADGEIRIVILTGAGRAFCAGVDMNETAASLDGAAFSGEGQTFLDSLRAFDRPIIAAINGYAVTGGFELALCCDVLIASTEAQFADRHARFGLLPAWGLSQKLPRLIGVNRAKEISFTGNLISAEQAEAWGLVNRVVAPDQLLPTCRALAADMAVCDPLALVRLKRLINDGLGMTLADGMAHESAVAIEWGKAITAGDMAIRRREL